MTASFYGDLCIQSSEHSCVCHGDGKTYPILVHEEFDGTTISVKLFDKEFDPDEIAHLKSLNGLSGETTYQIFQALDAKTRACEHTQETTSDENHDYIEQRD